MVGTLILFLVIIIFLAFFVGKNLLNVCTIWFFKEFTDISVAMLVFIAFGCGIVFSLLLLFISHVKKTFEKSDYETSETDKKTQKLKKAEAKVKSEKSAKEKKSVKFSNKNKKWSTNKETSVDEVVNSVTDVSEKTVEMINPAE